jgi:hypothetical protein
MRTAEEHGHEEDPAYWYYFDCPLRSMEEALTASVNPEEWHEITVGVRGPPTTCYIDDELAVDCTDQVGSIFLQGAIGLYAYDRDPPYASVRFDDVLVERI